jgi:hypothetical protein
LLPVFALLCAFLGSLCSARADQPSPAAIAKAKELLAASRTLETVDSMMEPISESLKTLIEELNPGCGPQIVEIMRKYFDPEIRKRLPEVVDQAAVIWARHFTIDEMDKLIAFDRSELGQKMIAQEPQIFQESMIMGRAWGQSVAREIYEKIKPELRNQGLKVPNI